MRNYFNLMGLLFCVLFCIDCSNDGIMDNPYTLPPANKKSYIQGFYDLENISVNPIKGLLVNKITNSIYFDTSFDKDRIYNLSDGIALIVVSVSPQKGLIDYTLNNSNSAEYWRHIEDIGDTAYNSDVRFGVLEDIPLAITDTLHSIRITCNKNFNASYPLGSDISELFNVYFEAPYLTVKNGYKSFKGENSVKVDNMQSDYPHTMIWGKLKDFNFSDYPFIAPKWFCSLDVAPDETDSYTFTITVTNIQGKQFTKTANPVRIKGVN